MQKNIDSSESFWTKENGIHALWSVLFLLCFLGVYVWMFFTIAEFQKLFRDFGADIFPPTEFIIQHSYIYLLFYVAAKLSFITYFVRIALKGRKEGLFKSLVKTNIAITVVIVVATFTVLYIPIFKLGSVI